MHANKIELIANHISDGIMEIDSNGRIVYCNKKAAELDDINIDDIIGKPLFSVYPSLNRGTSTLYKVLYSGEAIHNFPQSFNNYKGKEISTINTTLPVYENNRVIGAIEISRDVTNVKHLSDRIVELQSRIANSRNQPAAQKWDDVRYGLDDIITQNAQLIHLKAVALKAATIDLPVMICGETGTGKELFVQAIHSCSDRRDGPFVAQNCAALPSTLLEGILFGTVEGAFTGATNRAGLFEIAHGGTLFLDEINSMPIDLQAKLLRFLQDGWLRRVGDHRTIKIDVRIITALNTLPDEALKRGNLRSDLYYRLNTVVLELPSLAARRDDIALLADHFIKRLNRKLKMQVRGLTDDVIKLFQHYHWPGNVRELEHVIEGAMSMLDGRWITLAEMPAKLLRHSQGGLQPTSQITTLNSALNQLEKQLISQAMLKTGHNVSEAAQQLGIPRQTLQYKLKKYAMK